MKSPSTMDKSIEDRVETLKHSILLLVDRLRASRYVFAYPDEVFPGVERDVEVNISRIEADIGRVPHAVAEFWRQVGSVDLCGHHPDWTGCDCPDPLVINPSARAISEIDDFLSDKVKRLKHDCPYLIPIAPDKYHKSNFSGGMWYNVSCPTESDDPIVRDEGRELPFLNYIEMALSWGGFPGLANCRGHKWPLDALAAGLV